MQRISGIECSFIMATITPSMNAATDSRSCVGRVMCLKNAQDASIPRTASQRLMSSDPTAMPSA